MCVRVSGLSRRSPACLQIGHRGFMGLWGQKCHSNGLWSCGGCEDLLSVRSAILVTLAPYTHTVAPCFICTEEHLQPSIHMALPKYTQHTNTHSLCSSVTEGPPDIDSLLIFPLPLWKIIGQKANMISLDLCVYLCVCVDKVNTV